MPKWSVLTADVRTMIQICFSVDDIAASCRIALPRLDDHDDIGKFMIFILIWNTDTFTSVSDRTMLMLTLTRRNHESTNYSQLVLTSQTIFLIFLRNGKNCLYSLKYWPWVKRKSLNNFSFDSAEAVGVFSWAVNLCRMSAIYISLQ